MMTEWYVKEFSQLTGVSVRTLHHYDHIDLLKPSIRLSNGYRLYSEEDLLTLQLILALKFFGFGLAEIKVLMAQNAKILDHLYAQKQFLQEQVLHLQDASQMLETVICKLESRSINFVDIVRLIEGYRMTKLDSIKAYGFDSEKQKKYEAFLVESGNVTQEQIKESRHRVKDWKKEDWDETNSEFDELHKVFAAAIQKNLKPSDPEVQVHVRKHFQWVSRFWTPNKESYTGLGILYCEHPDFQKLYTSYHPKLAEFLAEAMQVFSNNELSGK